MAAERDASLNAIDQMGDTSETPRLSIVICATSMKRHRDLLDLLDSLEGQTCHDFEVILVIEKSYELFLKMEVTLGNRRFRSAKVIMNNDCRGLSNARNIGIDHSRGTFIAFIDDDAVACSRWVELILDNFDDERICGVTGDVKPLWIGKDQGWFPSELNWLISCSYTLTPTKRTEVDRGFGVNMAFRRTSIDAVGKFNTRLGISEDRWLGGEDTDMFLRIKAGGDKVIFDPEVSVMHKVSPERITYRNLIKRSIAGGVSVALMRDVCGYTVNQSKESSYLRMLLTGFYPRTLWGMMHGEGGSLKRITAVSMVVYAELLGFAIGMIERRKLPTFRSVKEMNSKRIDV